MERNRIDALIALLEDNDAEVLNAVTDNLLQQGISIIPHLEKAWERTPDEKIQERLEQVIHDIQFRTTINNLANWKAKGAEIFWKGLFIWLSFSFRRSASARLMKRLKE